MFRGLPGGGCPCGAWLHSPPDWWALATSSGNTVSVLCSSTGSMSMVFRRLIEIMLLTTPRAVVLLVCTGVGRYL
jgi:hypothetical protein